MSQGVVRALGTGCGLLEGPVRRHRCHGTVLRDRHVLGVRAERTLVVAEHPVAYLEGGDTTADGLDFAGELIPQHCHPRPDQPGDEPHEEGVCRPGRAIRPIHRRRAHPHEDLVVLGCRLVHLGDADHLGRSVAGVHRCLHGRSLSLPPRAMRRGRTTSEGPGGLGRADGLVVGQQGNLSRPAEWSGIR